MTRAWSLVASLGLVLIFWALVVKNAALLALALPYMVFALAAIWGDLPRPHWRVRRQIEPDHVEGGRPCRIQVSITNEGETLEEVRIVDFLPRGVEAEAVPRYLGEFRTGQMERLEYNALGVRGKYEFPGISVSAGDLMGLRRREEFVPCAGTMLVLPAAEKAEKIKISPRRTRVFSGLIRSRESGAGVEFFGTRAYTAGDPLRHLNWKAGARWDLLITNLFEQERIADIGIILDARKIVELRTGGDSLFEHSVRAAASLAQYFLREGNRVGLLVYGSYIEWTFPAYGKRQGGRIMGALAKAELGDHAAFKEFYNLPIRLFPPESQVVLISPLRSEDLYPLRHLRALGYPVLVISPDPIAFERRLLPQRPLGDLAGRIARMERDATLAKLRRSGGQVVDWDVSEPLWRTFKRATVRERRGFYGRRGGQRSWAEFF
jgi:uncharacterized protein (DUF58 family)